MKIGIAIYHSDASKYPSSWIFDCLRSLFMQVPSSKLHTYFYELCYSKDYHRYLHAPRFNNFRHKELENYAAAMNEIYSWIFEQCDVACNVNIDDYYYPERIVKLAESLDAGADIATSNYILVNELGHGIRRTDFAGLNIADELARSNNIVSNPGHMMKKHVFERLKFDPSLVPREDLQYWKDCLGAGFKIVIRPEHLHYYRIHAGQSGNQK